MRSSRGAPRPLAGGERVDRPHVLVLAPAVVAVEVPADEAVDVDERVAVDDHPADRLADGVQRAAGGVGGRRSSTRRTQPCSSSRSTVRSPAGQADGLAVAAQEAVGDRVVAVGPRCWSRRGSACVGVGRAGDVGGLAGAVSRAAAPTCGRASPRQSTSIRSPCERRAWPVTRPNWSKWWAEPNVEPTAVQRLGRHHPGEAQVRAPAGRRRRSRGRRRCVGSTTSDRHAGRQRRRRAGRCPAAAASGRVVGAVRHVPRQPRRCRPTPTPRRRRCRCSGRTIVYSQPPSRRSGTWNENHAVSVSHQRSLITAVWRRSSSGPKTQPRPSSVPERPRRVVEHDGDRPRRAGQAQVVVARRSAYSPVALIQNAAERIA